MSDHYGRDGNPHEPINVIEYYKLGFNIGNVVKYILRAGIKYPSIEGKIEDLKKAIWYLGREIDNLEKEKNKIEDMSHEIQFDDVSKDNEYDATLRLE